jgi:hypothetical protein
VLKYLALLALCGCVTTHDPRPIDAKFDETKRDWIKVYKEEIRVATENEDEEAYNFFFEEYMRLRIDQYKAAKKNSP